MASRESLADLGPVEIARRVEIGEYSLLESPSRSRVWLVFAKIQMPNGEQFPGYAFCKHCRRAFKYNKLSTSNLVKHKCYIKAIKSEQNSLIAEEDKTIESIENFDIDDNTNLKKLLTKLIIEECRSYDFIQSEGLKDVFKEIAKLGAKFGSDLNVVKLLPSLPEITENVSEIYRQCFDRIKSEIALANEHGFSLTSDIAMDSLTKQSYIVLTAHYIKSGVLTCRFMGLQAFEPHTNQNISNKIKQILEDFGCKLSPKFTLVSDPANAFAANVPDAQNVKCISQLLSKALFNSVKDVSEVSDIITACTQLINYLMKNGHEKVLGDLLDTCFHNPWLKLYNILKLVETNWNTIENLLQSVNEKARILDINLPHLRAVIKTLHPFEEAIETLEDSTNATLHLVIVYLHELKKSCDTTDNEFQDFECIEQLKGNLRLSIESIEREDISTLHKIALFLYPPTNKLLQFNDKEKKLIEDACLHLMDSYKHEVKPLAKREPESPTAPLCKRKKLFSDFVESETSDDPNELLIQEIQFYKNTRVVNSANFDAFSWWQVQKDNFPFLYKLSCTVLATPASCAAAKRIFATGSNLFRHKHAQISKEAEIEQIIFLKSNLNSDEIDHHFPIQNNDLN